jgi:hypothetical protein
LEIEEEEMTTRMALLLAVALLVLAAAPGALAQRETPGNNTPAKKGACRLHCGPRKTKVYDLGAANFTGDQIRGPRTIRADNLNVLRYNYKFSNTITFSQAVDLWSKLQAAAVPSAAATPLAPTPAVPTPKVPTKEGPLKAAAVPKLSDKAIEEAETAVNGAESVISAAKGTRGPKADCSADIPVGLDITNETNRQSGCLATEASAETTAVTLVKSAGQSLVSLLQRSGVSPALLIGYIAQELAASSVFIQGIGAKWPPFDATATLRRSAEGWKIELAGRKTKFNGDLAKVSGLLSSAKKDLSEIKETLDVEAKKSTGPDQAALTGEAATVAGKISSVDDEVNKLTNTANLLDWAIGENQRVLGAIPDLEQASSKYTDFQTAQEALVTWQTRMTDLQNRWADYQAGLKSGKSEEENPSPFSLSTSADCEFAFSRTKTTSVVLTRADLMPGTTATGPETVLSVTVECTSPFTVSAGVAFSTLGEHQFAIQQVPATPPATGTVNKFVATETSSFHPLPLGMIHARVCEFNDAVALHASFGMAGDFQSQSAGGSSAEFLIGPSISLFRTMFFTPGLHIGTKTSIGAGFNVGDVVPSNITTVPLAKSYTIGFGFAITFTKP